MCGVRTYRRTALDRDVLRMCEVARALPAAADLHRTALRTAHIRHTAGGKTHIVCRHTNCARTSVKARGTYDPLLIDRRARQCITRRCRHENETSVRFDETFIRNRLLHRRSRRDDRNLAVAVEVKRHSFTRCKDCRALLRNNNALVHNILAEKGYRSLIFCNERGAVDYLAVIRCTDKGVLPRHKVSIGNVHRGGNN